MLNPNHPFQTTEASSIRQQIIQRVRAELRRRINVGYKNINITNVESEVDTFLREMKII